jgi:hypothetical protein
MKNIMLDMDPNSQYYGDLLVENANLQLTNIDEKDFILQKLKVNLKFVYGEWFMDTTKGIKYFENVFTKPVNRATIESIFKSAIAASYGVVSITDFTLTISERTLMLSTTVQTTAGELSLIEVLP